MKPYYEDEQATIYHADSMEAEAAKQEGATAVGIEIEERWCEVAALRLQQ